jgi:hypothetical protein
MKNMEAVRFNEKVKRWSTLVGAGGLGLILTALSRWLERGLEPITLGWISSGVFLILLGVQLNELLQSEDEL